MPKKSMLEDFMNRLFFNHLQQIIHKFFGELVHKKEKDEKEARKFEKQKIHKDSKPYDSLSLEEKEKRLKEEIRQQLENSKPAFEAMLNEITRQLPVLKEEYLKKVNNLNVDQVVKEEPHGVGSELFTRDSIEKMVDQVAEVFDAAQNNHDCPLDLAGLELEEDRKNTQDKYNDFRSQLLPNDDKKFNPSNEQCIHKASQLVLNFNFSKLVKYNWLSEEQRGQVRENSFNLTVELANVITTEGLKLEKTSGFKLLLEKERELEKVHKLIISNKGEEHQSSAKVTK